MSDSFMHRARNLRKSERSSAFVKKVRHVALSADEFDTDLAALGVVTMFEESDVEVLVLPETFRLVRGEDASQVVTVDWRRRNERSIRLMVSGRFLALRHHVKSSNPRNDKVTLKQQRSQPNALVRAGKHSNKFYFVCTRRSQGLQLGPPRNKNTKVVVASARYRAMVFSLGGA